MDDKYYSLQDIADLLQVNYITVFRWVRAGKLKSLKAGKQYRIKKTDLDIFMNK